MPGAHTGHGFVFVIAAPDACGIVGRKSAEPAVGIIICGTGLAGCRHIVQSCRGSGTAVYNIFHRACKKISGGIFYCLMGRRNTVVDQYISVVIQNLCVHNRIRVGSLVGD